MSAATILRCGQFLRSWAGLFVALVLGLWAPLACILHCALVPPWPAPIPNPVSAHFLCDFPEEQPEGILPRALYELTPSAAPLLALVLLSLPLARPSRRVCPILRPTPPTPPPRRVN